MENNKNLCVSEIENGYYWVLLLNSGVWQTAKVCNGIFLLTGDTKEYYWENIGQIGEKIPTNFQIKELTKFKQRFYFKPA